MVRSSTRTRLTGRALCRIVGTVREVIEPPDTRRRFPQLEGRDLQDRTVALPDAFEGERNVVIVAFRRDQQELVDSWVPWLEARVEVDPGLRFYEVPTIGMQWSPARRMIDGGMAKAIGDPVVLRRTITVYTDVRRVTDGLGIDRTDTVWLFLVDATGAVRWRGHGAFDPDMAEGLGAAIDRLTRGAEEPSAVAPTERGRQFDFAFDRLTRPLLAVIGVVPSTAHVTLDGDRLVARFGPWSCETTVDNVVSVELTGPYRAYRAIGPRASMADRGLTFGSTTAGGVCLCFREPVHGLDPFGAVAHPGLTVTVADRDGFATAVRAAAGLA
jgi:hypothetical protein